MNHCYPKSPIPDELAQSLLNLSTLQQSFLSGYLWARVHSDGAGATEGPVSSLADTIAPETASPEVASVASGQSSGGNVTVISASQTGNASGLAKKLVDKLKGESLEAKLVSASKYKARQIAKEETVIIATSTQGDGEPPEEGVPLHSYLFGKKAPKLDGLHFAVLGLGDSSYPKFCQAGIDFDTQLESLGAQRLCRRLDADEDFESVADEWIDEVVAKVKGHLLSVAAG